LKHGATLDLEMKLLISPRARMSFFTSSGSRSTGVGVGVGIGKELGAGEAGSGFKYISTILKGSEHALILRFPSYRCVGVRVRVRVS
jgi:hypothetical protein